MERVIFDMQTGITTVEQYTEEEVAQALATKTELDAKKAEAEQASQGA
jgi:hypothetical protein